MDQLRGWPVRDQLLQVTQEILSCRKCRTCADTFVNGHSVLKPGWTPPRGWVGLGGSPHDIALVALNPGAPLDGEMEHYRELALSEANTSITRAQAAGVEAYCADQYLKPKRGPS